MARGVHGEKIVSAIQSNKMPVKDVPRLEMALQRYDECIEKIKGINAETVDEVVEKLVYSTRSSPMVIYCPFVALPTSKYREDGGVPTSSHVASTRYQFPSSICT